MVDNQTLRSTINRAYPTPPTFLPLTVGGEGGLSWWYFPCGTLIRVTFLLTRTPLAHYHLPPNPPSEQTTHTYHLRTPTSHSTTCYASHSTTALCFHTPLHCLHVSPTSADHLSKDMWQTTSVRTRVVRYEKSLRVYSQPLIIV
jgi:hypothetical protein